ncbi:uncharacterized protein EV154DRAFT_484763 [Mucor mucedo]|uniref:uncharacterized protein n=1 Tax=Mucor mucedo TaxID=29922 RepID=UPI002220D359|nr:uncharacterized protein EV154DRAFT_484763 [Mucor mucedo]KAI7887780.1 hypothetical protein EV154DRAFT_484763 [Mucor mucedo]
MSLIQSITQRSTTIYVPNHLIPFVCVFIIAKTPAILLVGFVLGYIMIQPIMIDPSPSTATITPGNKDIKLIEATTNHVNKLGDESSSISSSSSSSSSSSDEECMPSSSNVSLFLLDDDDEPMSNSSIDFENLMKFPSCPTTLPRLDTHFNFIEDDHHHIQSPNPSHIDWPAINQEIEYDQQRQAATDLFSTTHEKLNHHFPPLYSASLTKRESDNVAAVLMVENEQDENFSINIQDDLLIFPQQDEVTPVAPCNKPSLSSPGQLFKSKFQKAVQKMKKSSLHHYMDDNMSKRSSTPTKRAASLQLNSYFDREDPLFVPISPRPSASARVHGHFKGRLNKLFKK